MACSAGPDVSESGLVLALDAGDRYSFTLTEVEVLVVAGGGSGGYGESNVNGGGGGGGGAGGLIYNRNFAVTPGSALTVTIGAGGAVLANSGSAGNNGGNSVFGSLTAIGGGAGGGGDFEGTNAGATGGSGGGAGGDGTYGPTIFSAGTAGQGFAGGARNGTTNRAAAGGGGAGGVGSSATPGPGSTGKGGSGGPGLGYDISGTFTYYAGGGGGGASLNFSSGVVNSDGGIGGGGAGGGASGPSNGTANTGGGGGGGYGSNAGAGGSGIVIVRYPGPQRAIGGTVTTVGGHTIHTFTSSSTFTPLSASNGNAVLGLSDLSNTGKFATTVSSPTYSSANGGFINFNGSSQYIDCSLSSGLTGTGSWTMSAWFKINGAPSNTLYQNVIVDTNPTGSTGNMICVDWGGYNGGSQNQLVYASRLSAGSYTNLLGPVLTQGVWYNATVVRNGSTDTKLYTNGSLSATYTGDFPVATQPLVRIGRWTDGTNYSNCSISQVSIHNRALTASEVQQNFNSLRGRFGI